MHKSTYQRKLRKLKTDIAKAKRHHKTRKHLYREIKELELKFYGGFSGIITSVFSSKKLMRKMKKAVNAENPFFKLINRRRQP